VTNDFDKNGYVHLKEFLDLDNCKELTKELNKYIEEGKTNKDPQCPISEAIHGTVTFDKLLEDLLPHFEKHCGKRLYPTYSYARLYKPGEELKKHTDRPACEISATITLGFEGDVWSIYMAGNKIDMQVGDAVLYRGMDVEHWREKYTEGKWQAQVFLHYVDADGPHADQKYDGRKCLGIDKNNHNIENKCLQDYALFENHISDILCDMLIDKCTKDNIDKMPPYIGNGDTTNINLNVRNTERVRLSFNQGIGATLTATALNANHYWWKYHITHSNQSEFLIYKPEGHYKAHVDTFHSHSNDIRKLTALAFLNDDYEGGKFWINPNGNVVYPVQKKGTVLVFPSYMVHGVEPVTKGVRYSVVTWLEGPYFK
jgi:predicted 2-oxoglutarate/Fe(II)-dependent dioxygenase YbiX